MHIEEWIKKTDIEKAPEGFSQRVMNRINELPVAAHATNRELLNRKEKLFLLIFVLILSVLIYVAAKGMRPVQGLSIRLIPEQYPETWYRYFAQLTETFELNYFLVLSIVAMISFLLIDLLLRRRWHRISTL